MLPSETPETYVALAEDPASTNLIPEPDTAPTDSAGLALENIETETVLYADISRMKQSQQGDIMGDPNCSIFEVHSEALEIEESEIEAETRVEIDLLQMTTDCIKSDISALGKTSQKCLRRQPNILDTTPSDEHASARPVNLLGTICKFYIKDKRLLATIERRRQRSLIMHKYLSSFDSFDETSLSLFDELNTYQHLSLDYSSDYNVAGEGVDTHLNGFETDIISAKEEVVEDVELVINYSNTASQTSVDLADDNDDDFFIVGSFTEIGYNFINHILFSDQLSSNSNDSNESAPSTSHETFNGDADSVNDYDSYRTGILDEAVSSSTLTTTLTNNLTRNSINNNKTNTTQRILTNGSLRWSNKSAIALIDGQQNGVDIQDDYDVNNNEDDVVLLRRFAPGNTQSIGQHTLITRCLLSPYRTRYCFYRIVFSSVLFCSVVRLANMSLVSSFSF